ncbi:hypothetical protein GGI07_005776, partial [Coemansia sp. Benny D115]
MLHNRSGGQKPTKSVSSWASLFKPDNSTKTASGSSVSGAGYASGSNSGVMKRQQFNTLDKALENMRVVFDPVQVQPRGLVNTGNMCFMNVVLQALLYCAPFFNMLSSIKEGVAHSFKTETPLLEALIQYVHEFDIDTTPLARLENGPGDPFVPENVYEALRKKNVFQTLRGQQEDAQEFMSYLIDGIHEEMVDILHTRRLAPTLTKTSAIPSAGSADGTDEGSEWMEVGRNNKATVVRDSSTLSIPTPITRIFGGTLRSTLTVPHSSGGRGSMAAHTAPKAQPSSNREPFQWLALDISPESVKTIDSALDEFVAAETIEGYVNHEKVSVNATKQILLEKLPPVLVMHLKRFVFCPYEGVQKVHKFIEYPATLTIEPKWLAKTKDASEYKGRTYRLESVIYHHGSQASGGHYTCDLRRSANEWLRFDDVEIGSLNSVDDA